MSSGFGSVGGAILMLVVRLEAKVGLFIIASAGFALSLLALSLNPYAPLAFVFMACFGFSHSTLSITAQTIFQTEAPPNFLGRVVSLWSIGGGLAAITAWPIGEVGDALSLRVSIGFVAVMLLLMAIIVGLGARPLSRLGRQPTAELRHAEAAGGGD
jgi:ENTS family enterobactin (siderophore) exporter